VGGGQAERCGTGNALSNQESLGHLWDYTYKVRAQRFWEDWKGQLNMEPIKPSQRFLRMMERHLDGILGYCNKKVSLGYIESANLKARNVIRRARLPGQGAQDHSGLHPLDGSFRPWTMPFNNLS